VHGYAVEVLPEAEEMSAECGDVAEKPDGVQIGNAEEACVLVDERPGRLLGRSGM